MLHDDGWCLFVSFYGDSLGLNRIRRVQRLGAHIVATGIGDQRAGRSSVGRLRGGLHLAYLFRCFVWGKGLYVRGLVGQEGWRDACPGYLGECVPRSLT